MKSWCSKCIGDEIVKTLSRVVYLFVRKQNSFKRFDPVFKETISSFGTVRVKNREQFACPQSLSFCPRHFGIKSRVLKPILKTQEESLKYFSPSSAALLPAGLWGLF
jgi:hypothetical protein